MHPRFLFHILFQNNSDWILSKRRKNEDKFNFDWVSFFIQRKEGRDDIYAKNVIFFNGCGNLPETFVGF